MLSPVEISIIPNAGVVFLVPKSILNLFISDYEDIYEGIYNFIKFVEDELQPYMNQIGIDDIDELIISYELIKNNVYEIKALREDCINLDELEELASACDVKVVGRFFQKRSKPDPLFLISKEKIQELALTRQVRKVNLLIFDEGHFSIH